MNVKNQIHKTCIIDDRVALGTGNIILPNTIILGPTTIGSNNIIGPNVVIGSPGQDTRNPYYDSTDSEIEIGDYNIIREFTAIQKPCYKAVTKLGNGIFLMQSVHIPHDAQLHDKVVIAPMCVLAGITTLLEGTSLGMGVTIHQYSITGHYSMIAMGAALTKNVKPFTVFVPGKAPRVNIYAIKKYGFEKYIDEITKYVTEGVEPSSENIQKMTEEFSKLHVESKRPLYQ